MSNDLRHRLGAQGEQLACEHLERRGMTVVARNVRTRYGEIDIVAADDHALVFCEVKTRRAGVAANPFDGLRRDQRQRIRKMAIAWMSSGVERPTRPDLRFDAIGVMVDARGRLCALEHLEGCF